MHPLVLNGAGGAFALHLDLDPIQVVGQPGVAMSQWPNDVMAGIGYVGPTIGFGGNGISLRLSGILFGNSSPGVAVEIGWVQAMTQTLAEGRYGPLPGNITRRIRRLQPNLPVKDGDRATIWYKPDERVTYSADQMRTLSKFGPNQGLGFRVRVGDEVKTTFPQSFAFPGGTLPLQEFVLQRSFVSAVVVRATPAGGAAQDFCVAQVGWTCGCIVQPNMGVWAAPAVNFYQPGVPGFIGAPFAPPAGLVIATGVPVANTAEQMNWV